MRVYPIAVLIALGAVVVYSAAADSGPTSSGRHLGGDFPAFYAAGAIAASGDWDSLYSAPVQRSEQEGLIEDGGFLYFAYPPPVAAAYSPLSALDYRWAYLIHTAVMAAALWGAVWLARPLSRIAADHPLMIYAALMLTYPLWRAVTGGQNTAFTLLLIVAALTFERRGYPIASGVAVGLLLYKPQFGLVFLVLLVIRRRWRATLAAAGVAVAMAAFSSVVLGLDWLDDWLTPAREFARLNADLNSANLVSLPGALAHVAGTPGLVVGWVSAAFVAGAVLFWFWRHPEADSALVYAVAGAAAVLALPQPLFYELGLLVPAAVLLLQGPRSVGWIAAVGGATWSQSVSGGLGGMPSMLIALVLLASVVITDRRGPRPAPAAA